MQPIQVHVYFGCMLYSLRYLLTYHVIYEAIVAFRRSGVRLFECKTTNALGLHVYIGQDNGDAGKPYDATSDTE